MRSGRMNVMQIVEDLLIPSLLPYTMDIAYSPDLNPIEHVCNKLGRRIAARQPHPTCLPELRRALLDE
ncbi:hypothetical protein TNCV_2487961 [Trichonephila clavipes]|uniref:Tc1-like transposase DDE domain-containing protein n=1 Tax=Trichonephila clavipes TaxID=2585209 RepID=A0A8X6W0M7_TRICX|nr:hypothetical protein TNCV_2487961 [Trichonephila clavipes]